MTDSTPPGLPAMLLAEGRLKLVLVAAIGVGITLPYLLLGHNPVFPVYRLSPGPIDRLAGFDDRWIWAYVSYYPFLASTALLLTDRAQLLRFARGMAAIAIPSFVVFFFYPTATVRPPAAEAPGRIWVYEMIVGIDSVTNAAPSLHCALSVYVACIGEVAFAGRRPVWCWRAPLWIWCGLILWSTMAIKQHMFLDVWTGSLLGAAVYLILWRRRDSWL